MVEEAVLSVLRTLDPEEKDWLYWLNLVNEEEDAGACLVLTVMELADLPPKEVYACFESLLNRMRYECDKPWEVALGGRVLSRYNSFNEAFEQAKKLGRMTGMQPAVRRSDAPEMRRIG